MRTFYLFIMGCASVVLTAQNADPLYTIVSKFNSNNGSTIRMGSLNPENGFVSNIGQTTSASSFAITGTSLNQTTNRFNLISSNSILSFDILTGDIVGQIPISSTFDGITNFANVSHNNSNNMLYGLASNFGDNNQFLGMYLASLNSENGNLQVISQNSIGSGYQLAGTAVDPLQMIYYYIAESKIIGIDLYNGNIYSNPTIVFSNPNEFNFTNFAYNCADQTIYGLVVEDTQIQNPNFPFPISIYVMRFGKINPTTGVVTNISDVGLPSSMYSVNAGSTIDPITNTYYYSDGARLYGISLITGLVTYNQELTYEDGSIVNTMTNYNNCLGAVPMRTDSTLSDQGVGAMNEVLAFPNPTKDFLTIQSKHTIDAIEVIDLQGKLIKFVSNKNNNIDVQDLQNGMYFLKITSGNQIQFVKFVKV